MKLPYDYLYTARHLWMKYSGPVPINSDEFCIHPEIKFSGNTAFAGPTEMLLTGKGTIYKIELFVMKGALLAKDDFFGRIVFENGVSGLFMPVTGKIIGCNDEICRKPEMILREPYARGWLIKFAIVSTAITEELLFAGEYQRTLENKLTSH